MGHFAVKAALACGVVVAIAAILVGTEARVPDGLALTKAEIMLHAPAETRRVVVEAH
jgi:hypothetical protein